MIATGYSVEFRKVISSDGKTVNFDLPITTDSQPNLEVAAFFLKDGQLYQANQQIKVPPVQQQLQVEIKRNKDVFQPQQPADYDVYARDSMASPSAPTSALASSTKPSTPSTPIPAATS